MRAWYDAPLDLFLHADPVAVAGLLAGRQNSASLDGTPQQQEAWVRSIRGLQRAVRDARLEACHVVLEFDLIRLGKRIDALLLTDRAVLVLEWKLGPATPEGMRQVEDYALDLRDFHEASRALPIVPILVAERGTAREPPPMLPLWHSVQPPIATTPDALGALLRRLQSEVPAPLRPLDPAVWLTAAYRPVPGIVEAACMLFSTHGVAELVEARADTANLARTTKAIARWVERARAEARPTVVFVTGIPGAGKTLCGLATVFGPARLDGAVFLTGNVPLRRVLQEALRRDARDRSFQAMRSAGALTAASIQDVHRFLDQHGVPVGGPAPAERLVLFDEAQRAYDARKAQQGSQFRESRLTLSEPAHCLEILGRHQDGPVVVALIGGGQEINGGEAGLAEWGNVIAADPRWRAVAAESATRSADPRQRLADGPAPWLVFDDALDLTQSLRAVREPSVAPWVEAVLAGRIAEARRIAEQSEAFPVFVTRKLVSMRQALLRLARGSRRAGLVRSSGARRLRADGLGAELEGDNVADWFLNRWQEGDVRASDALEVPANEFQCQGLELDLAGVAWGNDLRWDARSWQAFRFAGTRWQQDGRRLDYIRNKYRVLLTRARYETIIWVPEGDEADPTRPPAHFDPVAKLLHEAGARDLSDSYAPAAALASAQLTLLR